MLDYRDRTHPEAGGAEHYLHEVFRRKKPWKLEGGMARYQGGFSDTAECVGKCVKQLKGDEYLPALQRCQDTFNNVEIDRLRVKPIVKITGEFWAQTTEGDGNFNMFNFLEREGAQVLVEPIGTWIMYMIHRVIRNIRTSRAWKGAVLPPIWKVGTRQDRDGSARGGQAETRPGRLWGRIYKIVDALGVAIKPTSTNCSAWATRYNSRAGSGEGHLKSQEHLLFE